MMSVRRGYHVWLRASLQPATLFGLCMIAACWIGTAFVISIERDKILEGAIQQSENLVRLFEENTDQTFQSLDRTLLLLRKSLEDDPAHFDLLNWSERTALIGDLTIQVAVVGAEGYAMTTSSEYRGPPVYIGDREHFLVHVGTEADRLFISTPVMGRASGKWSIQFSRRVRKSDGSFGGVIVLSVDPNFIAQFYETVDLGAQGSIVLRNRNRVVLAARGVLGNAVGRQVSRPAFNAAIAGEPTGHYWSGGPNDGVNRLVAYRVSNRFPLIFTVGRSERDIFSASLRNRVLYIAVAGIITVLVLLAMGFGIHHQLKLDRVRDNLRRSEAQARERAHKLELQSREIVHIAHHDILTGLANRVLLHSHIDQAFARARRHRESFAILCVDLDRFKIANDTLGHQAGDVLLQQVAARLRHCVREVDTVARVGGDEFVVLQANVARADEAAPLAARILQSLSALYDIDGNPVAISASIGIAMAPADGATTDKLLSHADLALYRAKGKGRNAFCFFDMEMAEVALNRSALEVELRDALARDEFELWYQPWVNITSGQIGGCEALLRWRHPVRGLLGPMDFIPIAEETGLIGRLGHWVLRRACRDAAGWPPDIKLAVNLSAAQFIGGNLYETVLDVLAESGLAANRLELEITETLIIEDYDGTREALSRLRRHGISIALDDFGTGYSSLTHLRLLLFNRIKIDKSFIAEMTTRTDCVAIVSAVIALGYSLGVSITAEGVETAEQLLMLRAAGCTEVQGYLFSRPKPASEILANLSAGMLEVVAA
jgi:diguanylate cyclase (GGDEF)-like protein